MSGVGGYGACSDISGRMSLPKDPLRVDKDTQQRCHHSTPQSHRPSHEPLFCFFHLHSKYLLNICYVPGPGLTLVPFFYLCNKYLEQERTTKSRREVSEDLLNFPQIVSHSDTALPYVSTADPNQLIFSMLHMKSFIFWLPQFEGPQD